MHSPARLTPVLLLLLSVDCGRVDLPNVALAPTTPHLPAKANAIVDPEAYVVYDAVLHLRLETATPEQPLVIESKTRALDCAPTLPVGGTARAVTIARRNARSIGAIDCSQGTDYQ